MINFPLTCRQYVYNNESTSPLHAWPSGRTELIMMKRTAAILCAAALAMITGATAFAFSVAESSGTLGRSKDESVFTLRSVDGKLAVESNGPLVIDGAGRLSIDCAIEVSGLRRYDRELLERGIEVTGYENLLSLLEDFSN